MCHMCCVILVEHKGLRSARALSYPKANNQSLSAYYEQGQDGVRKRLDYGTSIAEESPEWPLQVKQVSECSTI